MREHLGALERVRGAKCPFAGLHKVQEINFHGKQRKAVIKKWAPWSRKDEHLFALRPKSQLQLRIRAV